ncbi:unnamed protein product, partial [Closterium sp. NIES-53]
MGPRDDGGDPQSTGGGATLWGKLEETCRYYTGLPKPRVEARVVEFRSERQFVSLLQQGKPVAVAFTFSYRLLASAMLRQAHVWMGRSCRCCSRGSQSPWPSPSRECPSAFHVS